LPITQLAGALSMLGGPGGGGGSPLAGALTSLGSGGGGGGGGGAMSGNGAPSISGMTQQLMAGIYPTIQPLLEGAIRRLSVRVSWREGTHRFHVDVDEYVTNPGQTMATGDQMNSMERALGGGTPGAGTAGSGTPAATQGTPPAGPSGPAPSITLPSILAPH
jgi:hypothetical protein